ncbi:PREDICTED: neprilysin-11-like [Priapulus caudatus]|uniref:Neprilysin-11-like n=1 Tax=Priapulus caudatus TaxID=37621 RepID=A0ABM1E1D7_PRICU|nr:PREDICTED: neprilysin-11-like [Priapulus caudatus]
MTDNTAFTIGNTHGHMGKQQPQPPPYREPLRQNLMVTHSDIKFKAKRWSTSEKVLVFLLIVLLLAAIALAVALGITYTRAKKADAGTSAPMCTTSACARTESIDKKKDEPLREFLSEYGMERWPISDAEWDDSSYDLTDLLGRTSKAGFSILYSLRAGVDQKDSDSHILYLDAAALGLGSTRKNYYLDEKYEKYLNAYKEFMKDMARIYNPNKANAEMDVDKILQFEIDLAKVYVHQNDRRNQTKVYNPRTVQNISDTYTAVDWKRYIDILMPPNVTISANETVILRVPSYMEGVEMILASGNHSKRTVANYIAFRIIDALSWDLDERYRQAVLEFSKATLGVKTEKPRWKPCVSTTRQTMPLVAGYLYVKKRFAGKSKELALELINEVKEVFAKEVIRDIDWMSAATKKVAVDKANAVRAFIGYPEFIYNSTQLSKEYNWVRASRDHFTNLINIYKYRTEKNVLKLLKPVDKDEWHISPAVFNAYYMRSLNVMVFPAGILQPPLFSQDLPMYINFAGIGFVIGHEITHGFDDQGRQFNKYGNSEQWWSQRDIDRFVNKAKCFIKQYDDYTVEANGKIWHHNGTQTQGESIADSGGAQQCRKAYISWLKKNKGTKEARIPGLLDFTWEQIWYLIEAQLWCGLARDDKIIEHLTVAPHPLMKYRVNGPLANTDEFGKVWNCPLGSPMNPQRKCAIW